MIYAGIDYSISGPSITIHKGPDWSIDNCKIYTLSGIKKYQGKYFKSIQIDDLPDFSSQEERFDVLSDYFIKLIKKYKVNKVGIEGYSFGSRGQVFHIGENVGLLKHKIYKENIPFEMFAPTTVKKFATTSGKADKDIMYNAFIEETSLDLVKKLEYSKAKIESPISDIVDSYFICKLTATK